MKIRVLKLFTLALLWIGACSQAQAASPAVAPSALSASTVSASQINLRWQDNSNNEQGFIVQRSSSSTSGFVQIASLAAGSVSFSNTSLMPATTYYYRVAAFNKIRGKTSYSAFTNVVSATTTSVSPTTTTTTTLSPTTTTTTLAVPPSTGSILPTPTNIANGATVSLQCGTTYQGTLNLAGKSNVTVTTSGTCGKATITPGQAVTGWSLYQGSIYSAALPSGFTPVQVSVSDKPMEMAHWPNKPQMWAATGTAVPNSDVIGATLVYKDGVFTIRQSSITSTLVDTSRPYYVEGKLWMLDTAGEWAVSNGRLYLWSPDGMSPEGRVWASADGSGVGNQNTSGPVTDLTSLGINANNSSGVVISNVRVVSASDGISGNQSSNLHVSGVDVLNSSRDALYAMGSTGLIVENCTFTNNSRDGIGGWYSSSATVRNNVVTNTGTALMPHNAFAGINFGYTAKNILIDSNKVYNSGYIGITAYTDSTISNNLVDGACLTLSDGGGIYTAGFTLGGTALNLRIEGNTVKNVASNLGMGIYLDAQSRYVTVTRNTVTNAARGLLINGGGNNNTVTYNSFASNRVIHIALDTNGRETLSNIQINNNTFNSTNNEQTYNLGSSGIQGFATIDYNTYNSTNTSVFGRVWEGSYAATLSYSGWKSYMIGQDLHSTMNGVP